MYIIKIIADMKPERCFNCPIIREKGICGKMKAGEKIRVPDERCIIEVQKRYTEREKMIEQILRWNEKRILGFNSKNMREYLEKSSDDYLVEHLKWIEKYDTYL